MSNLILCERGGDVTTITLNRPEIDNRVSTLMAGQLVEVIAA